MDKIDLQISKEDVKKNLYNNAKVLTDINVVLQSLEKAGFVDQLKDCFQNLCEKEYTFLKDELKSNMCPKQNSNVYLKAVKDNFDVYKTSLKKSLRIMVEDVYSHKTKDVLKEYSKPAKKISKNKEISNYNKTTIINTKSQSKDLEKSKHNNKQYFFDDLQKKNITNSEQKRAYSNSEQKRLRSQVDNLKKEFYQHKDCNFRNNFVKNSNKEFSKDIKKSTAKKSTVNNDSEYKYDIYNKNNSYIQPSARKNKQIINLYSGNTSNRVFSNYYIKDNQSNPGPGAYNISRNFDTIKKPSQSVKSGRSKSRQNNIYI